MINDCGNQAAASSGSSKSGEQNFSSSAAITKAKPGVDWGTMLDLMRRIFRLNQPDFIKKIAKSNYRYKAAEALRRLN